MRPHSSLVHSRTRVTPNYALMPLEGFPFSRLPGWPSAEVRVLASPAIGAKFVQYQIDLPPSSSGKFEGNDGIETFFYVIDGHGSFGQEKYEITEGSFGLIPPGEAAEFIAETPLNLLILQKRYQAAAGVAPFKQLLGHVNKVPGVDWADTDKIKLQTLIPDEMQYDLAMNIFAFTPGFGLPIVETHVMEHGMLILEGKGLYKLGDDWTEVEQNDFIWIGPFCPQSFYAAGDKPARYIYYKDVNRDVLL